MSQLINPGWWLIFKDENAPSARIESLEYQRDCIELPVGRGDSPIRKYVQSAYATITLHLNIKNPKQIFCLKGRISRNGIKTENEEDYVCFDFIHDRIKYDLNTGDKILSIKTIIWIDKNDINEQLKIDEALNEPYKDLGL